MSNKAYMHYRNKANRAEGAAFERQINKACELYRVRGIADVEKTPEPMKPIKSLGQGRFEAVFTGKAQADYKGTLQGGRAIAFEAKYTDTGKMLQSRVTAEQAERLDRIDQYGGLAFVLCAFAEGGVYRIPWSVWRDMKKIFGRKYFTATDAQNNEQCCKVSGACTFLDNLKNKKLEGENLS